MAPLNRVIIDTDPGTRAQNLLNDAIEARLLSNYTDDVLYRSG